MNPNENIQSIDLALDNFKQLYLSYYKNPSRENETLFFASKNKIQEIYTRIENATKLLDTRGLQMKMDDTLHDINAMPLGESQKTPNEEATIQVIQSNDMELLYKNKLISTIGMSVGCLIITMLVYNIVSTDNNQKQ